MIAPWQKPLRGAQINPAHPLAKDLLGAWILNEGTGRLIFDHALGNHLDQVSGTPEWEGDGLNFVRTQSDWCFRNTDLKTFLIWNGPYTILVGATPTTFQSNAAGMFALGTDNPVILTDNTSGRWRIYHSSFQAEASENMAANQRNIVGMVRRNTGTNGASYYRNGKRLNSFTYAGNVPEPISFTIGADRAVGSQFGWEGSVHFVYLWNRALTDAEMALVATAPYAMFREEEFIPLYSSPSGGILITITDSGQGADAIGQIAVALGVADTGTGVDALPGTQAVLGVADSGTGTDTPTVQALLAIQDAGTGADAVAFLHNLLGVISDIGQGMDAVGGIQAHITLSDTGQGTEALGASVTLIVQDSGTGWELILLLQSIFKTVTDSGHGTDLIGGITVQAGVTDSGIGTDTAGVAVSILVADAGAGADAVSLITEIIKTIYDSGHGADSIGGITVRAGVTDTGTGTDTAGVRVSLTVTDLGSAVDLVNTLQAALVTITDSGHGTDVVGPVSVSLTVADSGAGIDVLAAVQALLRVLDAGAGVDIVSSFEPGTRVRRIIATITAPGMTITVTAPGIKTTIT